jgi:hypothetical protein
MVIVLLLSRGELILANTAKVTLEIIGKIFPFYVGFFLIVFPSTYITNIFHGIYLQKSMR